MLQRRFAYIGHAIAKELKKLGVEEFCGFVELRDSLAFLTSQKDIAYTSLLLYEDVFNAYRYETLDLAYLSRLEHDFGMPNLWPYFENDRIVRHGQYIREYPYDKPRYSYEDMLRILQAETKAVTNFLDKEKPDVLLLPVITDISTLFFYQAAKKRGIQVFLMASSGVRNLLTATEKYETFSYIGSLFNKIRKGEIFLQKEKESALSFLKEFRSKPSTYSIQDTPDIRHLTRKRQFSFLRFGRMYASLAFLLKIWIDYLKNTHKDDPSVVKPWHHLFDRCKRKLRVLIGFDDLYDTPDYSEPYAFFPLQLEPEMATTLFSRFYTDQLWLATQAAASLPVGYTLYVKEHPAMYSYRTRAFYKKLKNIPNVKLIPPTETGLKVVQHAKIIITLTGTCGWEGVLFGKPAITFGDAFYNIFPSVTKCENIHELPYVVSDLLKDSRHDEKQLIDFLTALFAESVPIDLITMWDIESALYLGKYSEQIHNLAAFLFSKMGSPEK
ncbi:MAG: hypothetical protein UY50_C0006G0016 [Parcubacteria group bacterium GW2011_GWA2_49_9]|nr:MAG: hypothetical protein UY50_C0006G0016 [Parcubacteria group bacterium GW2011_GWA2_49_9]